MHHYLTTNSEVKADKTLTLTVPEDFPIGPVKVTVIAEDVSGSKKIRTFADLLASEHFGMWADREDLPKTNDEFLEWRRNLWERKQG